MAEKEENDDQAYFLREYAKERNEQEEMDVLSLPPRKEVHNKGQTPIKWRVTPGWTRLLLILLILIVAIVISYRYWDIWFEDSDAVTELKDTEKLFYEVIIERDD